MASKAGSNHDKPTTMTKNCHGGVPFQSISIPTVVIQVVTNHGKPWLGLTWYRLTHGEESEDCGSPHFPQQKSLLAASIKRQISGKRSPSLGKCGVIFRRNGGVWELTKWKPGYKNFPTWMMNYDAWWLHKAKRKCWWYLFMGLADTVQASNFCAASSLSKEWICKCPRINLR